MIRISRRRSSGFTLLEVILALSIGLILLGALYFLLSSQLRMTQRGRDVLDDSAVTRGVLTRMTSDIHATLSPLDPRVVPDYALPPADETTDETTMMETENPDSTTPQSTTGTDSSKAKTTSTTQSSEMSTEPTVRNTVDFNVGVLGSESYFILTIGKAQRLTDSFGPEAAGLRRILYFVVDGVGLVRYEINNPTGEEARLMPGDVPMPEKHAIAPEVSKLSVEYFNGSGWVQQWNGFTQQGDLSAPIGPPSAIRVVLSVRKRGLGGSEEDGTVQIEHVIAIPNGNHFPQGES